MIRKPTTILTVLLVTACVSAPGDATLARHDSGTSHSESPTAKAPVTFTLDERTERQSYVAHRTQGELVIDGRLDEASWQSAPSTAAFVDIQGGEFPRPQWTTTAKMLWDDDFFYVAAELEEPHLWGTLTERDSIIFHDNDFEVFIDPDGDTHHYYEFEINALGTEWDLLLVKPYRDGGPPLNEYDTAGLQTAVQLNGTLNDPTDVDQGWTVEMAIPWNALRAIAGCPVPPHDGDVWWVNFSRVQWQLDVQGGRYVKRNDETGKPLPEDNWVWSPQGVIDMHRPESWGLVLFANEPYVSREVQSTSAAGATTPRAFVEPSDLEQRATLRAVYEAQRRFRKLHGRFAERAVELGIRASQLGDQTLELFTTPSTYEARLTWRTVSSVGPNLSHSLRIDELGHLW